MPKSMFSFRIETNLLNKIKKLAEKEYRTTSAQIEKMLAENIQKNQDAENDTLKKT